MTKATVTLCILMCDTWRTWSSCTSLFSSLQLHHAARHLHCKKCRRGTGNTSVQGNRRHRVLCKRIVVVSALNCRTTYTPVNLNIVETTVNKFLRVSCLVGSSVQACALWHCNVIDGRNEFLFDTSQSQITIITHGVTHFISW